MRKILIIMFICLFTLSSTLYAKSQNKVTMISGDSVTFMTFEIDDNVPFSQIGLPNDAAISDKYAIVLDKITIQGGKKIIEMKLQRIP